MKKKSKINCSSDFVIFIALLRGFSLIIHRFREGATLWLNHVNPICSSISAQKHTPLQPTRTSVKIVVLNGQLNSMNIAHKIYVVDLQAKKVVFGFEKSRTACDWIDSQSIPSRYGAYSRYTLHKEGLYLLNKEGNALLALHSEGLVC